MYSSAAPKGARKPHCSHIDTQLELPRISILCGVKGPLSGRPKLRGFAPPDQRENFNLLSLNLDSSTATFNLRL